MIAVPPVSMIIRPLRPMFRKFEATGTKTIIGQTAVVRSGKVNPTFGEATMDDGGAGLILKIRAGGANSFKRGDRVVLLEYLESEHAYRVVSEEEFSGL